MRISDWSSDVGSSDLIGNRHHRVDDAGQERRFHPRPADPLDPRATADHGVITRDEGGEERGILRVHDAHLGLQSPIAAIRSEERRVGKELVRNWCAWWATSP